MGLDRSEGWCVVRCTVMWYTGSLLLMCLQVGVGSMQHRDSNDPRDKTRWDGNQSICYVNGVNGIRL
jgi:hypothetical protein